MKTLVFLDIETYSPIDLTVYGARTYAGHDSRIIMVQLAVNDGPVELYEPGPNKVLEKGFSGCFTFNLPAVKGGRSIYNLPALKERLESWIQDPEVRFVIHNGYGFDCILLEACLGIKIPPRMVIDTVNRARLHGFPGASLSDLCRIAGIPEGLSKKNGKALIDLFCRPAKFLRPGSCTQAVEEYRANRANEPNKHTHPKEWEEFREYGRQDVIALRALYHRLPRINVSQWERDVEIASQQMNERGLPVDIDNVQKIADNLVPLRSAINLRLRHLSNGIIDSPGQRKRLMLYLEERGHVIPDTRSETLEDFLAGPENDCTELVEAFLDGQKTSTSKYQRILDLAIRDSDGTHRIKDALVYRGAIQTGRWSARGFQPQNLPSRRTLPPEEVERILNDGTRPKDYHGFAKSALRQMIQAPVGKKILVVDFAGIESRIQAVLGNETRKIQAFREFDAGTGPDSYVLAYSKAFGVPVSQVTKFQRTIGKVMELALGYQGGPNAFRNMALVNGIKLVDLVESVSLSEDIENEAIRAYYKADTDMPKEVYIACSGLVRIWRARHPGIVALWDTYAQELDNLMPTDTVYKARVPSGRWLFYYEMQRESGQWSHITRDERSNALHRRGLYGGKVFQNICQATSADILADVMVRLQRRLDSGETTAELIFTVHDELVLLMDEAEDPGDLVLPEIKTPPSFLPDIPLNVSWKLCNRYQK